jgi:hypothetical protein
MEQNPKISWKVVIEAFTPVVDLLNESFHEESTIITERWGQAIG